MVAVGVLALQGAFREHRVILEGLGAQVVEVRAPADLDGVQGLIIPGGESTVIGNLLQSTGLDRAIVSRAAMGMPIWGTCAGAILLATDIEGSSQPRLGLWEMRIARNAYGRQVASFETILEGEMGELPAMFIRAPIIRKAAGQVLASHEGNPVLVTHGHLMATTFHPELTGSRKVHELFLAKVLNSSNA